jgi:four helix bundle suffix protein
MVAIAILRLSKRAELDYDGTVRLCELFMDRRSRTVDQMVQAARSGRQNIAEGCMGSGTSKKTELKLIGVARASLEELLLDYEDFHRQRESELWGRDHEKAVFIRKMAYKSDRSYTTNEAYIEERGAENSANTLICLIHQTNYLLNQLLRSLEKSFLEEDGFAERLYRVRKQHRDNKE